MSDQTEVREDGEEGFPWQDVEAARKNLRLQRKHSFAEARENYGATAKPCPKCSTPAGQLNWFYFQSPAETWEHLCGRAGWMTVCEQCHVQVDFFLEVMN